MGEDGFQYLFLIAFVVISFLQWLYQKFFKRKDEEEQGVEDGGFGELIAEAQRKRELMERSFREREREREQERAVPAVPEKTFSPPPQQVTVVSTPSTQSRPPIQPVMPPRTRRKYASGATKKGVHSLLQSRANIKNAFLVKELLGTPKGLE